MRFFPLFFRLVHRNCLIFGTKVILDNTYTLTMLKQFEKFLSPLIPLNPLKNCQKCFFLYLLFRLGHLNFLFLVLKAIQVILTHWKYFGKFLFPSDPLIPLKSNFFSVKRSCNSCLFLVSRRSRWTFGFTSVRPYVRDHFPENPRIRIF